MSQLQTHVNKTHSSRSHVSGETALRIPFQVWHFLAIIGLAYCFFLVGLNRVPVPTVDGAVRASEARNILNTGQLWPILYKGETITDHPPLFLWLTALSYKVFGVSDFAANLVPRLAAFMTILLTAFIAIDAGLGAGIALLAAFILCCTRDFVLSSVRGYIEPLLEMWIYAGLWFTLHQRRRRNYWPAFAAGVSVWLAAFSKGPVALWPLLFFLIMFLWNGQTRKRRLQLIGIYLGGFALCTAIWAAWVSKNNHWPLWSQYWHNQVLGSALEGRGGAQEYERLYFLKILLKYYWPWLPLLLWSIHRCYRRILQLDFGSQVSYSWIFMLFGVGFVAAFSLVRWKFWYYIAPAYPAFALLIATSLHNSFRRWLDKMAFAKLILYCTALWVLFASVFPVSLHRERVPEVMAFKETIGGSDIPGPVWFVENPSDHNMVGTSGEWYFHRDVVKVLDQASWEKDFLPKAKAWIIVGATYWEQCQKTWCKQAVHVQNAGQSALVLYTPPPKS